MAMTALESATKSQEVIIKSLEMENEDLEFATESSQTAIECPAMTSVLPDADQPRLFRLPLELRQIIYEFSVDSIKPLPSVYDEGRHLPLKEAFREVMLRNRRSQESLRSLCNTGRQIREELHGVLRDRRTEVQCHAFDCYLFEQSFPAMYRFGLRNRYSLRPWALRDLYQAGDATAYRCCRAVEDRYQWNRTVQEYCEHWIAKEAGWTSWRWSFSTARSGIGSLDSLETHCRFVASMITRP